MLSVTTLGINSALPAYGRHPTSQIVKIADQAIMMDCGEGTQMQMQRYRVHRGNLNYIFISHLHGDHFLGLAGLLNSLNLTGRTQDMHLYGPALLEDILTLHFRAANTQFHFPLHFHTLPMRNEKLMENEVFEVSTFLTEHRIECHGFVFKEKKNPRSIDPQKAKALSIPYTYFEQLQKGEDYVSFDGTVIPNDTLTIPNEEGKSYGYCADTRYIETFLPMIEGVDLLYHETTYLDDFREKAYQRFHSTTKQAATIAVKAQAKKLLIGHFSSQYEYLDAFLSEAQEVFPNSDIAVEGRTYEA